MSITKTHCCRHFGMYMVYTTEKQLKVKNRFIAGVYLFGMLAIIIYVIAYTIIIDEGYQQVDYPTGYVSTKVKGFTFSSEDVFYDAQDLVTPSLEMDGLFLTCSGRITRQTWDICDGESACDHDDNCTAELYSASGLQTGYCGEEYCLEKRWCPKENSTNRYYINNLQNFTIFLKIAVRFKEFGITLLNTEDRDGTGELIYGYNLFKLSDIFEECGVEIEEVQSTGVLVIGSIIYKCDFNKNDECNPYPAFSWKIVADDENSVSKGFNYRRAFYVMENPDGIGKSTTRDLVKYYGLRFRFNIQGSGGKWSWIEFTTTLGSGIALTALSSTITELLLKYCIGKRKFYRSKRLTCVSLEEEQGWIRANKKNIVETVDKLDLLQSETDVSMVEIVTAKNDSDQKISEMVERGRGRILSFL